MTAKLRIPEAESVFAASTCCNKCEKTTQNKSLKPKIAQALPELPLPEPFGECISTKPKGFLEGRLNIPRKGAGTQRNNTHSKTPRLKGHLPCSNIHGSTFHKKYHIPCDHVRSGTDALPSHVPPPLAPRILKRWKTHISGPQLRKDDAGDPLTSGGPLPPAPWSRPHHNSCPERRLPSSSHRRPTRDAGAGLAPGHRGRTPRHRQPRGSDKGFPPSGAHQAIRPPLPPPSRAQAAALWERTCKRPPPPRAWDTTPAGIPSPQSVSSQQCALSLQRSEFQHFGPSDCRCDAACSSRCIPGNDSAPKLYSINTGQDFLRIFG